MGIKSFVGNKLVSIGNKLLNKGMGSGSPMIIADPTLIQEIAKELEGSNAGMILERLQNLEKAIYHLSARFKQFTEKQDDIDNRLVAASTVLEQVLNAMDSAGSELYSKDQEDEPSDLIVDDWETTKKGVQLN